MDKLAIIAGRGYLPVEVARSAAESGIEVHIFVIQDQADPAQFSPEFPTQTFRFGAAGTAIKLIKQAGCKDLVFAGSVRRPSLLELRPDAIATKVIGSSLLRMGDDGLLRAVLKYLEEVQGFRIHKIHDFLGETARPKKGLIATTALPEEAWLDIEKGRAVLQALGTSDVGQALAVQSGLILAIEAIEGTDAMIDRCRSLKREGEGPILVKLAKPQQTEHADLPTIGPDTIRNAAKSGFRGIVVEAGRSIVLGMEECRREAERLGIFLIAIDVDGKLE